MKKTTDFRESQYLCGFQWLATANHYYILYITILHLFSCILMQKNLTYFFTKIKIFSILKTGGETNGKKRSHTGQKTQTDTR